MENKTTYSIAYDCDLRRPGCVLLQAAMGGTVPTNLFGALFDAANWIIAPTPGLKLYPVSENQLRLLSEMSPAEVSQ